VFGSFLVLFGLEVELVNQSATLDVETPTPRVGLVVDEGCELRDAGSSVVALVIIHDVAPLRAAVGGESEVDEVRVVGERRGKSGGVADGDELLGSHMVSRASTLRLSERASATAENIHDGVPVELIGRRVAVGRHVVRVL
jgi:hypothetical protein